MVPASERKPALSDKYEPRPIAMQPETAQPPSRSRAHEPVPASWCRRTEREDAAQSTGANLLGLAASGGRGAPATYLRSTQAAARPGARLSKPILATASGTSAGVGRADCYGHAALDLGPGCPGGRSAAGGVASFSAAVTTLPAAKGQAGNSIGNSIILKSLCDFSINSL